jgi:hypothetical protein
MNANKVTPDQKLAFVEKIIMSDIFDSSEVAAVAILQKLVDDAKNQIATKSVNKLDKQFRESGRMISDKNKVKQMAIKALDLDSDTIFGAYARELGVKF